MSQRMEIAAFIAHSQLPFLNMYAVNLQWGLA